MTKMPFDGIRVIGLTRVWAGPLLCRILGDFGAQVINVEPLFGRRSVVSTAPHTLPRILPDYPEGEMGERQWNRRGIVNNLHRNQLSLTLDLSVPRAVELFKRLVKISDIVVENNTPRVMANFGLDYPALKQIKEDLIMISMPGFGMTGPYRDYRAFGTIIDPVVGISSLMGYPGGPPCLLGNAIPDPVAALHGVSAVLVALWHRDLTGEGQYIDLSQAETAASVIGDVIVGFGLNKRIPPIMGNRHAYKAPHGCYRCTGKDMWVVIAVSSDEEWQAFCQAIGSPPWTKERRWADQSGRWENQDELDRLIEEWTIQRDHYEVMHTLQGAGVACGPVLTGTEVLNNPHLNERNFFVETPHPDAGTRRYAGIPIKLSKTPATFRLPAPCLGEHNDYVLRELLGLSEEEIAELEQSGVIGNADPDI